MILPFMASASTICVAQMDQLLEGTAISHVEIGTNVKTLGFSSFMGILLYSTDSFPVPALQRSETANVK